MANVPPPAYPQQQPYVQQPYPQQLYPPQPGYPQPGYPPPAQQGQQSTIVINQPQTVVVAQYGNSPMRTNCPHCQSDIVTAVDYEVGGYAWMICGIITLVGLFIFPFVLLGCCFIPFCVTGCKDAVHMCPNCRQTLARVPRMR